MADREIRLKYQVSENLACWPARFPGPQAGAFPGGDLCQGCGNVLPPTSTLLATDYAQGINQKPLRPNPKRPGNLGALTS